MHLFLVSAKYVLPVILSFYLLLFYCINFDTRTELTKSSSICTKNITDPQ